MSPKLHPEDQSGGALTMRKSTIPSGNRVIKKPKSKLEGKVYDYEAAISQPDISKFADFAKNFGSPTRSPLPLKKKLSSRDKNLLIDDELKIQLNSQILREENRSNSVNNKNPCDTLEEKKEEGKINNSPALINVEVSTVGPLINKANNIHQFHAQNSLPEVKKQLKPVHVKEPIKSRKTAKSIKKDSKPTAFIETSELKNLQEELAEMTIDKSKSKDAAQPNHVDNENTFVKQEKLGKTEKNVKLIFKFNKMNKDDDATRANSSKSNELVIIEKKTDAICSPNKSCEKNYHSPVKSYFLRQPVKYATNNSTKTRTCAADHSFPLITDGKSVGLEAKTQQRFSKNTVKHEGRFDESTAMDTDSESFEIKDETETNEITSTDESSVSDKLDRIALRELRKPILNYHCRSYSNHNNRETLIDSTNSQEMGRNNARRPVK
ncbi:homeobox-like protein HDP1 [Prorops nasuta]|uniref:homeobox-like protein HDP1 n=1 Tax=Prorops nasuta TaxID=863751 RepID=UPI0034CDFD23